MNPNLTSIRFLTLVSFAMMVSNSKLARFCVSVVPFCFSSIPNKTIWPLTMSFFVKNGVMVGDSVGVVDGFWLGTELGNELGNELGF